MMTLMLLVTLVRTFVVEVLSLSVKVLVLRMEVVVVVKAMVMLMLVLVHAFEKSMYAIVHLCRWAHRLL